uniref:Uncharacterized protein n=1 Tax=Lygus hesperus TaxID=30085 RepID=A0A0K8SYR6_LYGHE
MYRKLIEGPTSRYLGGYLDLCYGKKLKFLSMITEHQESISTFCDNRYTRVDDSNTRVNENRSSVLHQRAEHRNIFLLKCGFPQLHPECRTQYRTRVQNFIQFVQE